MIDFTITGNPQAQKRHRPSARGGYYDPSSKEKKEICLQIARYKPKKPYAGEISLKLVFYMPRPKHHYRTGKFKHLLKEKCKDIVYHSVKPDLSNLIKLYEDVLENANFYVNDSQICALYAEKMYGEPKTEVTIHEIL